MRSAQLLALAYDARGCVRYELQLKRPALRSHGLVAISDMTEEILMALREQYFRRVRFDVPVTGLARVDAVMRRLASEHDPRYKDFPQVFALLKAEALGIDAPRQSSGSLSKYRDLARQFGLSAADTLSAPGPAIALDFAAGVMRTAS